MEANRETAHTGEPAGRRHLVALLNQAAARVSDELEERLHEAGLGDIRRAHGCVFGNLDREGMRLTDIAERAGLTKQSVGEVASDLERLGYLERAPDPQDGRAKILRLTPRGAEAQERGFAIIADIERSWAERHGEERMATLRSVLEEALAAEPAAAALA